MTSHAAKEPLVAPLQTSCPLPLPLPGCWLGLSTVPWGAAPAEWCSAGKGLLGGLGGGEAGSGMVQRDSTGVVWFINCCLVCHLQQVVHDIGAAL